MKKETNHNKVKIIPLGGLEQIGMNMTAFEYEDSIIVVDCGMAFPSDDMLGIDLVIPDVSYLKNNIDKVKGFVITHGHEDHIGATPYVLDKFNVPVYGTRLTLALIETKLAERGVKPRETVRFVGTCDEEKGGAGAAAILEGNLFGDPDFLLIGEPTDCQLGIAQKGCIWLELTVKGKTCHGAYPWMGINAAEIGFELCQQIKTYVSCMEHPVLSQATASITQVHGGVANNMIPDEVRFIMDVRTVPGVSHEKLLQEIDSLKQVMEISYPGLEVKVQILNERIPVEISRGHHRAKQLRKAAERATGKVPEDMGINFFTDASVFLRKKQVPTLLFGPGSPALCHKTDESMELARYYEAIETYMEFLTMGDEAEG